MMPRQFDWGDFGGLMTLLGTVFLGFSLISPNYVDVTLDNGGYVYPAAHPSGYRLSTLDEIHLYPVWCLPILVAFLASWIMCFFVLRNTRRKSLAAWNAGLLTVVLIGLSVGLCTAGLQLVILLGRLDSGYWLFIAAMLCVGIGSIIMAAGSYAVTGAYPERAPMQRAGTFALPPLNTIAVGDTRVPIELVRRVIPRRQPTKPGTWALRLGVPMTLLLAAIALLTYPAGSPLRRLVSKVESHLSHAAPLAPSATPTLPVSARELYLQVDVPWTVVTLDGHRISPPVIGRDAPLLLSPGSHQVRWEATPFPAQSCQLSIPSSYGDNCDLSSYIIFPSGGAEVNIVELDESLDTLPPTQQTALVLAARVALSNLPAATVLPGDAFVTVGKTSAAESVATDAFRASLTIQLQTSDAGAPCQVDLFSDTSGGCGLNVDCARFCSLPWSNQQAIRSGRGPSGWLVLAIAYLSWTYRSLDGSLIASNVPLDVGSAATNAHLVMLSITWDAAGWHVQPVLGDQLGRMPLILANNTAVADNPACATAQDLVVALFHQQFGTPGATVHMAADTNPSDGCLVVAGPADYIVRFGIVIPANQAARQAAPTLGIFEPMPVPHLSAHEQQLDQLLLTMHGQYFPIPP